MAEIVVKGRHPDRQHGWRRIVRGRDEFEIIALPGPTMAAEINMDGFNLGK